MAMMQERPEQTKVYTGELGPNSLGEIRRRGTDEIPREPTVDERLTTLISRVEESLKRGAAELEGYKSLRQRFRIHPPDAEEARVLVRYISAF